MMNIKKVLTLGLAGIIAVTSMTGCGASVGGDVTKYPLVPALTEQEVIDFYAEALKYDSVITKNLEVHETTYVEKEVSEAKKEKVLTLYGQAETILSGMEYEYSVENAKIMSSDTFNYIKGYLNGNTLDNPTVSGVTGALGYYFVDVEYTISEGNIGTFTQKTPLLGINGAFVKNAYDADTIDTAFLSSSFEKLNEYYATNKIPKTVTFDINTGEVTQKNELVINSSTDEIITDYNFIDNTYGDTGILDTEIPQTGIDKINNNNVTEENTGSSLEDLINTEDTTEVGVDGNLEDETVINGEITDGELITIPNETPVTVEPIITDNPVSFISSARTCPIDVQLFNRIIGSSYKSVAYMPALSEVYNIPQPSGLIQGIGIYPSGGNGLGIFGFDRSQLSGTVKLRYVFKDTVDGSGDIIGVNVYPKLEKINTGFTTSDSNVIIPDFLMLEFEKLIERADRAEIDCLLASLIGGSIYEDMGYGVLTGYNHNYSNLLKNMSTIRQVIARDNEENAYLLEIETTRIEGPIDVDSYGTYRDKSYIVIQQKGNEFVITDRVRMSRQITSEPSITPDSSIEKRLVALNLSGEVSDYEKTAVNELLRAWYDSGTYRVLNGPKTINYKGQDVNVEKGMYDCFNNDVSMLTTDDKEYMNSEVRSLLIKYGTNVNAIYTGTVTEWMGGYENQVELTTEELIQYEGRNEGIYMQVYYLVSRMGQEWVIDERTVLDKKEVAGSDLNDIASRISQ